VSDQASGLPPWDRYGPEWSDEAKNTVLEGFALLEEIDQIDLLRLWAAVMLKLQRANLIHSSRSVSGDAAEKLVADHQRGTMPVSASQKGYDVLVEKGRRKRRLQVKALRFTDPRRSSIGEFSLDGGDFDELWVVLFEYDMTIREVLWIKAAALQPMLTKGSREGRGRLSLGPGVRKKMHRISGAEFTAAIS
jgi:hypothetical protein